MDTIRTLIIKNTDINEISDDIIIKSIEFIDLNYPFYSQKQKLLAYVVQAYKINKKYQKQLQLQGDKNLHIDTIFNMTKEEFKQALNPKLNEKKIYVNLDRKYVSSETTTSMTWDIYSLLDNTVSVKNIKSIKIMDFTMRIYRFVVFQYFYAAQPEYKDTEMYGLFGYRYEVMTILIEELKSQSMVYQDRNCHFIGRFAESNNVAAAGQLVTFGEDHVKQQPGQYENQTLGIKMNKGEYHFNDPIRTLDQITLSIATFNNIFELPVYKATGPISVVDNGVYLTFTILLSDQPLYTTSISSSFGHYLFIDGFTTTDPTSDADLIYAVNNTKHTLSALSDSGASTSPRVISIEFDIFTTTNFVGTIPSNDITVYVEDNRYLFNLEITYEE